MQQPALWFPLCLGLGFDFGLKSLQGAIPKLIQPGANGPESGWIDVVDAPCSLRAICDETCGFQNLEVLGDGRSADRQAFCEFANSPRISFSNAIAFSCRSLRAVSSTRRFWLVSVLT